MASLSKIALSDEVITILSEEHGYFLKTMQDLEMEVADKEGVPETAFQWSVLLVRLLEGLETELGPLAHLEDIHDAYAPVVINAEYVLVKINSAAAQIDRDVVAESGKYLQLKRMLGQIPDHKEFTKLDQHTELMYNPFLPYWVGVIERIQPIILHPEARKGCPDWWLEGQGARLAVIKAALGVGPRELEDMRTHNPRSMMTNWLENLQENPIDVSPFVDMLKTRAIYDRAAFNPFSSPKADSPGSEAESIANDDQSTVTDATDVSADEYIVDLNEVVDYPDMPKFEAWVRVSPEECFHWLVRLPVNLKALDFINKVVTSDIPAKFERKPADLARDFLQHALRKIENMNGSGSDTPRSHSPLLSDSPRSASRFFPAGSAGDVHASKEDMIRAIDLLIVFLRNVISRAVLNLDEAFLDVNEICVRYIWLPQVRDFRAWLDEVVGESAFGGVLLDG